jgi:hypothetical protein
MHTQLNVSGQPETSSENKPLVNNQSRKSAFLNTQFRSHTRKVELDGKRYAVKNVSGDFNQPALKLTRDDGCEFICLMGSLIDIIREKLMATA